MDSQYFSHPGQCVTVFGLELVLLLGQRNEAEGDRQHRDRFAIQRVDHCRDDEKPGNDQRMPCDIEHSKVPPTVHSTTMKVPADSNEVTRPVTKSTGMSVAIRKSSLMRCSGLA